jgi:hypothetical protein
MQIAYPCARIIHLRRTADRSTGRALYPRKRSPTQGFGPIPRGIEGGMELSILLIIIGIVLALLVNYALGILCILIGLVLLILPRLRAGRV